MALATVLTDGFARAQTTERVSVATGGAEGNSNSHSRSRSISADGRFVAFYSQASDLVAGDTNGSHDVFVRDRQSDTTERVSVATGGTQGNSGSFTASISADGRFVAFWSFSSNLVAGDTNGFYDVFVRDRQNGTTERVSVATGGAQGNSTSRDPSISADGRFVAFDSLASNLVADDTNATEDAFVHDRQSGTTERVSVATGGAQGNSVSYDPSISADGLFVAFQSFASNLVAGDTNGYGDIFVHDRQSGTTERVSVDTGGAQGNSVSNDPSISADGLFVAFQSVASNLIAGDTNEYADIFVRDRQRETTELVSVGTGNGPPGNVSSHDPSISADGRFVAFHGLSTILVPNDTNLVDDVFVRDRQSRTTERVSVATNGAQGNLDSVGASISADGRFVAFQSAASNLVAGDTNGVMDVFVRDRGQPPIVSSCFGNGTGAPCPCGNSGIAGHGCQNSAGTGGALLSASGSPSLSSDTLVLTSSGGKESFTIFLQGSALIAPVLFGDGLRCVGGTLERLFNVQFASGGVATAPQGSDPPVSVRSAALGDPIPMGATRHYQTYYRDGTLAFCPDPPGNNWNASNSLSAVWGP